MEQSLPVTLEIRDLLKSRNARLKNFSTVRSQFAPCVMCANVPVSFWKTIDNNNRSTERQIGNLKHHLIRILSNECNHLVDTRLRACVSV